ncbi:MAG TPA: hypothetical protein ENH99_02115 [Candidatus Pacearchaeota archaeon]|nr:hypothetical protein [Candidatus Pacearchaeota archaeon]
MKIKKKDFESYIQIGIIVILTAVLFYNLGGGSTGGAIGVGVVSASDIIPSGVPAIYGEELGITYDDVSPDNAQKANAAIRLLGNIDRTETLEGADLERYINILYTLHDGISCEYCCGARSIIFEDGKPACGCAHSYAMRGLTKYLIINHGDEFTDEEILIENGKWKVLFFPGIHEGKAAVLKEQGVELNYINLASNKYRGVEKGQASGGMVGGC